MLIEHQLLLTILASWILSSSLVTVYAAPFAPPINKTIVPGTLPGYVTVLDDAGPIIKFNPPPIINGDRTKGWSFLNDSRIAPYFGHSVHSTSMKGATATLTFVGTGIGFLTALRPNHGSVSIQVDGKDYGIVDTYAAKASFYIEAWSLQGLPSQDHTIIITAVSDKNAASSGTFVDVSVYTGILWLTSDRWFCRLQHSKGPDGHDHVYSAWCLWRQCNATPSHFAHQGYHF